MSLYTTSIILLLRVTVLSTEEEKFFQIHTLKNHLTREGSHIQTINEYKIDVSNLHFRLAQFFKPF